MMKASKAPRPACAYCGNDATEWDMDDHRPACSSCLEPAVDVGTPSTLERVTRMLRMSPGMDIGELARALGEADDMGRARISASVSRALRTGALRAVGAKCDRMFYLAGA